VLPHAQPRIAWPSPPCSWHVGFACNGRGRHIHGMPFLRRTIRACHRRTCMCLLRCWRRHRVQGHLVVGALRIAPAGVPSTQHAKGAARRRQRPDGAGVPRTLWRLVWCTGQQWFALLACIHVPPPVGINARHQVPICLVVDRGTCTIEPLATSRSVEGCTGAHAMQSAGSHSLPVLSTGSTRKAVLISGRAAGDMAESLPEALARTMRGSVRLLLSG